MVEADGQLNGHDEELVQGAVELLRSRLPGYSDAELRSIAEDEIGRLRARAHLARVARERFSDGP
jgi:hypothetical protein